MEKTFFKKITTNDSKFDMVYNEKGEPAVSSKYTLFTYYFDETKGDILRLVKSPYSQEVYNIKNSRVERPNKYVVRSLNHKYAIESRNIRLSFYSKIGIADSLLDEFDFEMMSYIMSKNNDINIKVAIREVVLTFDPKIIGNLKIETNKEQYYDIRDTYVLEKIRIKRSDSNNKEFDLIDVSMTVCYMSFDPLKRKEFVKINLNKFFEIAKQKLEESKEFKQFGISINCLKCTAQFQPNGVLRFVFELKPELVKVLLSE